MVWLGILLIVAALTHCHDDRTKASSLLGLSRSQLHRLIKAHKLDGEVDDNRGGDAEWFG